MFGSVVIDVALGMVVIYLVLSLAASVLLEALMELSQRRGRMLHAHVVGLLGAEAAAVFYADARVLALMSGSRRKDRWLTSRELGQHQPRPHSALVERALLRIKAGPARRLPSYIAEATFADIVLGWLREPGTGRVQAPSAASIDGELLPLAPELIAAWSDSYRDAAGDPVAFHAALMAWFRNSTDRLSGEYRRKARAGLLMLGFGLALLVDAGTPRLIDQLFVTPDVRAALVELGSRIDSANGAGHTPALTPTLTQDFVDAGRGLLRYPNDPQHSLRAGAWSAWGFIGLGYAITALAISLGATFWFSALQKLLSLRNAKQAVDQAHAERAERAASAAKATSATVPVVRIEPPLDLAALATQARASFQPSASEETPVQALYLGLCAYLAYLDAPELPAHPACVALAFEHIEPFHAGGCEAWVFRTGSHNVVAFRGTEGRLDDILADAHFALSDEPGAGRVHRGFQNYLEQCWPSLQAHLAGQSGPVWFTGHSLGGALAVLAASRWSAQLLSSSDGKARHWLAGVVTFGQPRVGDVEFSRRYDERIGHRSYRYVNHCDIVPTLPPTDAARWIADGSPNVARSMRFEHIGQVRYFDVIGQLHRQPGIFQRLLDRFLPPEAALQQGAAAMKHWALARGKEHVGDHGMLEYLKLLARVVD